LKRVSLRRSWMSQTRTSTNCFTNRPCQTLGIPTGTVCHVNSISARSCSFAANECGLRSRVRGFQSRRRRPHEPGPDQQITLVRAFRVRAARNRPWTAIPRCDRQRGRRWKKGPPLVEVEPAGAGSPPSFGIAAGPDGA
jgi:hypothetical protein